MFQMLQNMDKVVNPVAYTVQYQGSGLVETDE